MAFSVQYDFRVLDRFSKPMQRMSKAISSQKAKLKNLNIDLKKASVSMKSMGDGAKTAGAALTGALVGATVVIKKFDAAMNETQAALGEKGTAGAMVELRTQAKKMGATTAFSAAQAASAQAELAKAGLNVKQITGALPNVLSLAAAGTLSMGEAAGITTSILAGFGFGVEQSGRVSDVLAKAAASAKTDVSAMGFAFTKAAPAAKAMGVSFETTAAQLAAMQDAGLGAEVAGTGLKSILFTLAKPSKAAEKAISGMGISIKTFRNAVKSGKINEVFKMLKKGGIDAAGAATIFGKEMGGQALILAEATGKIDKLTDSYKDASGTAKKMAKTKMQGLPGAIALLQSKAEGAIIALGDAGLSKVIVGIAGFIGGMIDKFNNAPAFVKKATVAILAIGPALLAAGFAASALSFAMGGLAVITAPITGTVAAIAAGVAAVAAAFGYWYNTGHPVVGLIAEIANNLVAPFAPLMTLIGGIDAGTESFSLFSWAMKKLGDAVYIILQPLKTASLLFKAILESAMALASLDFDKLSDIGGNLVGDLSNQAGDLFDKTLDFVGLGGSDDATESAKQATKTKNEVSTNNVTATANINLRAEKGTNVAAAEPDLNTGGNVAYAN